MKQILIISTLIVIFTVGAIVLSSPEKNTLYPESAISHGHGLAVDVEDSSKLYIATHYGLFLLKDEKDLYRIGGSKDDYMGFSLHPTNASIFFSSGHPASGGNIGFQKSEDAGFTWKKVSNGAQGPVDFHALAVSPVDPKLMYGWYAGALQRSLDGGETWEIVESNLSQVIQLAADTQNESTIFAATTRGLFKSTNKGEDFTLVSETLKNISVSSLAISPMDPNTMLSFSENLGLAKSSDAGLTWETIQGDYGKDSIFYIAFAKQEPLNVYFLTQSNAIYKSMDGGASWSKIL